MIDIKTSRIMADVFKINLNVVDINQWHKGLNIELEHRDITKENLILTSKIAIAHLKEFPDYYDRLEEMEKKAVAYWKDKKKPNIFN